MNAQVVERGDDSATAVDDSETDESNATHADDGERREDHADDVPRSVSKDDAFHILQNARRRAVLRYLLASPGTEQFRMRDLAEEVAAWEHETTVAQLTSDERQRVYIALYQSHLPKLNEHGVIEYNQSRGVVETTPLTHVFAPYLDDGLHGDTDLTIEDAADEAESTSRGGLTRAFASFLDG